MKRMELKKDIDIVKKISSRMPKTLNEALNFNEEDEYDEPMEEPIDEPTEKPMEKQFSNNDEMDVMAFVDDIRKKSLKGMASLADNPDDERYQLLKKIWQICDKKPEQQTAFNNPNTQQPQQPANI